MPVYPEILEFFVDGPVPHVLGSLKLESGVNVFETDASGSEGETFDYQIKPGAAFHLVLRHDEFFLVEPKPHSDPILVRSGWITASIDRGGIVTVEGRGAAGRNYKFTCKSLTYQPPARRLKRPTTLKARVQFADRLVGALIS